MELLRQGLTRSQKLIEIGPCHNPIVPKRDGWNVYSIDHADQKGLRAKYKDDPAVDPLAIEPVDYVWTGGRLSDAVPSEQLGTFDVFIASHVVEHTPDLVAFLDAAATLTRADEGRVVMAVPDKRVCFDYYRPVSTTGDILEAFYEKRTRHTRATLWDHFAHLGFKRENVGWVRTEKAPVQLIYRADHVAEMADLSKSDKYVDAHSWVFVPASLELILLDLAKLGISDWQVARAEAMEVTEFLVWLSRGAKRRVADMSEDEFADARRQLFERILLELDEVSLQMPDSIASHNKRQADEAIASASAMEQENRRLRADLQQTSDLLDAVRATKAWKARARLRRILGLPPTVADR